MAICYHIKNRIIICEKKFTKMKYGCFYVIYFYINTDILRASLVSEGISSYLMIYTLLLHFSQL